MLYAGFMLLQLIKDIIFHELYNNKYALIILWSGNLEIVQTLLTKLVVFHMQIAIVMIRISKFERTISIICKICWYLILNLFDEGFYELFEEDIGRSRLWADSRPRIGGMCPRNIMSRMGCLVIGLSRQTRGIIMVEMK